MSMPTAQTRTFARRDEASARSRSRQADSSARSRSRRAPSARDRAEKMLFGVPARFMRPRLILFVVVALLVAFGALMVYSASSVTALQDPDVADAAYFFKRQLLFAAGGVVLLAILAKIDYHVWLTKLSWVVWFITLVLLVAVRVAGTDNDMGATRWIAIGGFQMQPSEFAKISIVLTGAQLAERYFDRGELSTGRFLLLLLGGVCVPLGLILIQPDKGTTMVLALTLVVMGYLAGAPKRFLLALLVFGVIAFLVLSLKDVYSRNRLLAMLDPWSDPYDGGYQLIQGFYAFASGGLFGVGIGFSRQKYSYLPMAYNDYIFAIVGEECGLVGTLGVLALFAVFMWAGFMIARHAPDLAGTLIAAGCTTLVMVQLLLNVCGVLGLFPLSGKPIPFLSYGGSSMLSSLMIVGLVVSVSIHSRLPETAHDDVRRSWQLEERGSRPRAAAGLTLVSDVGEPQPRSARAASRSDDERRAGFTVVDGGGGSSRGGRRSTRGGRASTRGAREGSRGERGSSRRGRVTTDASGRRRIDLGPSAADRLRGRDDSGGRR